MHSHQQHCFNYYRLAIHVLRETMKLKSWLIAIVAALLLETEYSKGKMFISECEIIVMPIYNIILTYQHITLKEIFAWKMDGTSLKDGWRCVKVDSGGQYVIEGGAIERRGLYAGTFNFLET